MAGRISADVKRRLKEAGLWDELNRRREELKREGLSAKDALASALVDVEDMARVQDLEGDATPGSKPRPRPEELAIAPAGLAGKAAGEPEVVRWVARNIDNADPSPEECPDPFAWTLLRDCRSNPAFRQFFVEKLWSKLIPSRSQLDATTTAVMDGKPTIDLIRRIQKMRDKAEGRQASEAKEDE